MSQIDDNSVLGAEEVQVTSHARMMTESHRMKMERMIIPDQEPLPEIPPEIVARLPDVNAPFPEDSGVPQPEAVVLQQALALAGYGPHPVIPKSGSESQTQATTPQSPAPKKTKKKSKKPKTAEKTAEVPTAPTPIPDPRMPHQPTSTTASESAAPLTSAPKTSDSAPPSAVSPADPRVKTLANNALDVCRARDCWSSARSIIDTSGMPKTECWPVGFGVAVKERFFDYLYNKDTLQAWAAWSLECRYTSVGPERLAACAVAFSAWRAIWDEIHYFNSSLRPAFGD